MQLEVIYVHVRNLKVHSTQNLPYDFFNSPKSIYF